MKKLAIAVSLALAACASPTPAPITQGSQPSSAAENSAQTGTLTQAEIDARALAAQNQANQSDLAAQARNLHSVYFDYGTTEIKPEYNTVIQQQADFIKSHPGDVVTLEGNTDERGSDEYNLALGETRASAVRKAMALMGIAESRMKTASFGEEKPRLTCHEESCWKENRRVDFNHQSVH